MWYLKLMRRLLEKLPEPNRSDGELFLNELFLSIKKAVKKSEMEFHLGLVDKSFLKFGNKATSSLSLTEFTRYILGLSILYVKSSDDFAIWNSDFIPIFKKFERFLDAYNDGGSSIQLLNKFEWDVFADLNHKVDVNFNRLRAILRQYGTTEIAQSLIDSCQDLDSEQSASGFKLLLQDAAEIVVINSLCSNPVDKDLENQWANSIQFSLDNPEPSKNIHRLSIFKFITDVSNHQDSGCKLDSAVFTHSTP